MPRGRVVRPGPLGRRRRGARASRVVARGFVYRSLFVSDELMRADDVSVVVIA